MIEAEARVLDLGCGRGEILEHLRRRRNVNGVGVDIDMESVVAVIDKGFDAFQADIDGGLKAIPDGAYQYAILSQTLQAVRRPRVVLREMVRIAENGIVAFSNRGHWKVRLDWLWRGQVPRETNGCDRWTDPMEINPMTLRDFIQLCREESIEIVDRVAIADGWFDRALTRFRFDNLGAERALVKVRRGSRPAGTEKNKFRVEKNTKNP